VKPLRSLRRSCNCPASRVESPPDVRYSKPTGNPGKDVAAPIG
jgi:hypothetical protein